MIKEFKQNREVILIIFIAILSASYLSNNLFFIETYLKNNLNNILLPVFGVLFGSLITAYTLIVAFSEIIPKNVKETKAYKKVNIHFFITLLSLLIILITSLLFYFFNGKIIMFINILLSVFSFFMFFLLIITIYQLVKLVNRKS